VREKPDRNRSEKAESVSFIEDNGIFLPSFVFIKLFADLDKARIYSINDFDGLGVTY
jgi:hypothetical protein